MPETAVQLYGYQRKWLEDSTRFKIGLWCRQSGKSFAVSLEAVLDAVETGSMWVLLSAGERQSKELMEKVRLHLEAMQIAALKVEEDFFADTECRQLTVRLPNGGRIIGLPANPSTARGFTANVILDEFAFHQDSHKIWTALYPTVTRGLKLRIVSTPQGRQNQFYKLYTGDNGYAKIKTDIYQAVTDGLPVDIDQLRTGLDDEDAWAQEYECQFLDEATAFLTYELIANCESEQSAITPEGELVKGEYYIGIDVGRKRDLTVIWLIEKVGDCFWTRQILTLEKAAYHIQELAIERLMTISNARRCCIDATGIGNMLAERLQTRFGTYRAEPVIFTNTVKQDLAVRTRRIFEDRRVRIPVDNKIRQDLHSVKKTVTAAGNIRFDAERTKDGHADRFWALSLALMATDEGNIKPEIIWL